MTTSFASEPGEGKDEAGIEAISKLDPRKMSADQIHEEIARLTEELHKTGAELTATLTSAMLRRFPGSLELAVERTARLARMRPERVWLLLRTDFTGVSIPYLSSSSGLRGSIERIMTGLGEGVIDEFPRAMALCRHLNSLARQRFQLVELQEMMPGGRESQLQRAQEREMRLRGELERLRRELERLHAERKFLQQEIRKQKQPGREPPAVVPDAPGHDHQPDPLAATSVAEFVELLRKLHVWAGEVSLRELARRSPESISHSTFGEMLNTPSKLPTQRTVQLFVHALGCDKEEVQRWVTAWRQLRFKRRICPPAEATVTALHQGAGERRRSRGDGPVPGSRPGA